MLGESSASVASWSRSWLMWVKRARFGLSCSTKAMERSRCEWLGMGLAAERVEDEDVEVLE